MKQILSKLFHHSAFLVTLLCLVSLLIWFYGPLVVIDHQIPLAQPDKRYYLIAVLWLGWILKELLKPATNETSTTTKEQADLVKLDALKARFDGAIRFLKNTALHKNDKSLTLSQLPWYLLIGPANAGKTALLTHSNIKFMLAKQYKHEKLAPTETCNWSVTRDVVLVDVPSFYATAESMWEQLLTLTAQRRGNKGVNTIIVALPLSDFLKQPHQKKIVAAQIKQQLLRARAHFPQLNCYFVITKCDLIPGFIEFFAENSIDELTQAWGITLPSRKDQEKLTHVFSQRFDALIKRLNNQLILRLHQERDIYIKTQIKDFPLQMEKIKETLISFLNLLALPDLELHGVYLTSALQMINDSKTSFTISNELQTFHNPPAFSRPYFIRQFILQGILSNADRMPSTLIKKEHPWQRRLFYGAIVALTLSATLLLGRDFQQGVMKTYAIQNHLAQYQLAIQHITDPSEPILKALPLLNSLREAALPPEKPLSRLANLSAFYSTKSQKTANIVYQNALQTIIQPELKNYFENYLKTTSEKNPARLYAILKAYLMLGDLKKLQPNFIIEILQFLLPNTMSAQARNDLAAHITTTFSQATQASQLNNSLIAHVRHELLSLPSHELAFVILKNMANNNSYYSLNFNPNSDSLPLVKTDISAQIPTMFTASAYPIISQEIILAATESLQGNFVLGFSDKLANDATIQAQIENLHARYIENYVDIWESLLTNLKLTSPQDLSQVDHLLMALIDTHSPLLQLLQTIKHNTQFAPILAASPKLQALHELLSNTAHTPNLLGQILIELQHLHANIQIILHAIEPDKAAFEFAKTRFITPTTLPIIQLAEEAPEPLKNWVNNLVTQSWAFIVKDTSHYIDRAWRINVITLYNAQIANRTPFNPDATQEVDLQQLADFIGKQGKLAMFHERFLQPFIDTHEKEWQWRVVDNQKLAFNPHALAEIQQAMKLQNISKYVLFTQSHSNEMIARFSLPEQLLN